MKKIDEDYMSLALDLAKKGKNPSPNPMVGCIVIKNGRIIGKGYHKKAGGPHAEVYALREAGADAKGSTLYVNLEPCAHHGKTPPCSEAIIKAGVKRVVSAMVDPNPLVSGKGHAALKASGIETSTGILEEKARELNKFFIKYIKTGLPFVLLKAAISLDGKIAVKTGDSKWISNSEARKKVHILRNQVDAVLIGLHTFLTDNPHLTVRIKNASREPYKIILAGKNRIQNLHKSNLYKENRERLIIVQNTDAGNEVYEGDVHRIISLDRKHTMKDVCAALGKMEITSLLIEGGGSVFTKFIDENIVDEYVFFIAPIIIGNDGIPFYKNQSGEEIGKAIAFKRINGAFVNGNVYMELKR
mgnify:CR=1 FL=1